MWQERDTYDLTAIMTAYTKPAQAQGRQDPNTEERELGLKPHSCLGHCWYFIAAVRERISI